MNLRSGRAAALFLAAGTLIAAAVMMVLVFGIDRVIGNLFASAALVA